MAKKFLVNVDLGGNQLLNARMQPAGTAPSASAAGQLYYNTGSNALFYSTGSGTGNWVQVATGSSVVASLNSLTGALTIAGTTNQIAVNSASSTITLSLPTNVTLPGKTTLTASTTGASALNVPSGVDPTTPVSGDFWNVSGVLKFNNGTTTRTITFNDSPTFTGTVTLPLTTAGYVTTTSGGVIGSVATIPNSGLTNSAITINSSSTSLGGSVTLYAGTTTLQTSSANQALTGISSITLPGATSGTAQIIPTAAAGTGTVITLPAVSGTVITTGDTGTVTNTMLAGSIANNKLSNSSVTIGSTSVSLGGTAATIAGLTLTTPVIDQINASGVTATTSIHPTVTTGSIAIGAGLTTGALNIATVGTGATPITIGHTNSTLTLGNFSSAGFLKTNASGLVSVDTNTYLTSSTGVSSIAGTSNQITASASTGAVTLSFPTGGVTLPGKTTLTASTTAGASLSIPAATAAPTTPVNGDIWTTPTTAANILYYNGATKTIAFTDSAITGFTGQATLAQGGTNANLTAVNGGIVWSNASQFQISAAGSSGQILQSNGAAAPTWLSQSSIAAGSATNATNTAITDDTATNATMYPTWVTANTGNLPQKVTSTKLTFNPSTGNLASTTFNGLTLTAAATGFTIAGGTTSKTLTINNTLALSGTDGSTLNIGAGGTLGSAAFTASTAYEPAITTLSIAKGGTNGSATPTAGTIAYGTGTAYAFTSAGTSGQVLTSAASSAPTWTTATNANTASAIVQRDASGNFAANMITLSGIPTQPTDAATKAYVDGVSTGVNIHDAVAYATTAALGTTGNLVGGTITTTYNNNALVSSTTGTIGTVSGSGPFTATITGMSSTANFVAGQVITSTAGTGNFGAGTMTVVSVLSSTSISVSSTATFTAGTVTNIIAGGVGATLTIATSTNWTSITIDGQSLVLNDRVLIKNQAAGLQNGIYTVTQVGSVGNTTSFIFTRATDNDMPGELTPGDLVYVLAGTTNANQQWVQTSTNITVGTTSIVWTQFSGASSTLAGAGLVQNGNSIDVGTASTSRIVVNTDNIDLATVTQSNTTGTDGINFVQSHTIDSYGRTTGTVTANVRLASTAQTGIASFNSASFAVSGAGDVTIKSAGVSNAQLANSTISGVSLGSNLFALSAGSGLTINTTTYNGSAAATISLSGSPAQKYTGTITGDNTTTAFTLTHSLGTRDVNVQVYQTSAGPDTQYDEIEVDINRLSTTQVRVTFAAAPANTSTYNVVVIG